jgi:putative Mg2+ transporter-C (MgtC) family protein
MNLWLAADPPFFGGPGQGTRQIVELFVAFGLTALIGLERELQGKSAGVRTQTIVGTASALILLVSKYGFNDVLQVGLVEVDPSRVAAQIVSGIGFLGAGAILKYGVNVRGLTTAASLWAVAAVGMAAGAGSWGVALGTTAIVIFSLGPLRFVERRLFGPSRSRLHVQVLASDGAALGRLLEALDTHADTVREVGSTRSEHGAHQVDLEIRSRTGREAAALLAELDGLDGVDVASTGHNED